MYMLDLTPQDRQLINMNYQTFLLNLKSFLTSHVDKSSLIYAKAIINMLHQGNFSIDRTTTFSNDYPYLSLPSIPSEGVYVTYGVCCCRHATSLLKDSLDILGYKPTPLYIYIDEQGTWHKVTPPIKKANHIVLLLTEENQEYLIDAANDFILKKLSNGNLIPTNLTPHASILEYQDSSIDEIGKTLKKYYTYRNFGIEHVYD